MNEEIKVHDFKEQLAKTETPEAIKQEIKAIKKTWGEDVKIKPYTKDMAAQLDYHCDYVVSCEKLGKFTVDLKQTGYPSYTCFIETVSMDTKPEEKSWFYSSVNYVLFYWKNKEHKPFCIPINHITRKFIEKCFEGKRLITVPNRNYNTLGYVLTVKEIRMALSLANQEQSKLTWWMK